MGFHGTVGARLIGPMVLLGGGESVIRSTHPQGARAAVRPKAEVALRMTCIISLSLEKAKQPSLNVSSHVDSRLRQSICTAPKPAAIADQMTLHGHQIKSSL